MDKSFIVHKEHENMSTSKSLEEKPYCESFDGRYDDPTCEWWSIAVGMNWVMRNTLKVVDVCFMKPC